MAWVPSVPYDDQELMPPVVVRCQLPPNPWLLRRAFGIQLPWFGAMVGVMVVNGLLSTTRSRHPDREGAKARFDPSDPSGARGGVLRRGRMPLVLEITLVLALLGGGLASIIAFSRWHASRIERSWRAAAERLGGTLTFTASWVDVTCSIVVVIDGQSITVTRGRAHEVYARGAVKHPADFELRVYPRPPSWLVDQSRAIVTGDPSFDAIFAAEAKDLELGKAWLDLPVREELSRAGAVWVHVRDGAVVGNRPVYEFEPDAIDRLARAVGAIAAQGLARSSRP